MLAGVGIAESFVNTTDCRQGGRILIAALRKKAIVGSRSLNRNRRIASTPRRKTARPRNRDQEPES
jgi:hypothetical protein